MSKGNPPPGTGPTGFGSSALPADVLEALARNQVIEAIKRLRAATGLGLKEAKDVVEAHLQGQPLPPLPPSHEAVLTSVPPPVLAALHQGQKIEAIRLLREHTGLGLKEAKDVVDALPQANGGASGSLGRADGLAPGEVSRGGPLRWVGVVVVLAALLAWWLLRKS